METVTVDIDEPKLSDLIARVEAGAEVVITRGHTPVARIVPIMQPASKRQYGILKGKISIGPEFFEPLPPEELAAWEQ